MNALRIILTIAIFLLWYASQRYLYIQELLWNIVELCISWLTTWIKVKYVLIAFDFSWVGTVHVHNIEMYCSLLGRRIVSGKKYNSYPWHTHTHNNHWSHPHCDFNSFQRNKSISHSDFFLSFLSLSFLHFTYVCIFQLQRNHFKQIETRIQRIIRSGSHSLFCVFVGEL